MSNLQRIRSTKCLESAELLLGKAKLTGFIKQRRASHLTVSIDGTQVILRDQAPLHEGNIEFEDGWNFEQIIASLNHRVFFWPGVESGPIDYGRRHYEKYEGEKPAVLRVSTASLLRTNQNNPPLFCRYNSGSPRCSDGKKSPRGPRTFMEANHCTFLPSQVVEVTFVGAAILPADTQFSKGNWLSWENLFA